MGEPEQALQGCSVKPRLYSSFYCCARYHKLGSFLRATSKNNVQRGFGEGIKRREGKL
jgi:hypothetical protein